MNTHPILFRADMVNALLDGRKTQTRRVVSSRNSIVDGDSGCPRIWPEFRLDEAWVDPGPSPAGNQGPYLKVPRLTEGDGLVHRVYPRYWINDLLWVKETWQSGRDGSFHYAADDGIACEKWRPSIFMKKTDSRLTLRITEVRAERVQDISEYDAMREGDPKQGLIASENTHRDWFLSLWDSINAKRGFGVERNPWVWALTFEVIRANVIEVSGNDHQ